MLLAKRQKCGGFFKLTNMTYFEKATMYGIACLMCLIGWMGLNVIAIKNAQLETITAYTQDDIIYLEGTHVFSESGIYDIQCKTRNRAIEIFENLTVPDNEN